MKTQTETRNAEAGTQSHSFGISYKWADAKGRMHLGRSVGSGRSRAHAERRFFRQHRHVFAEEGSSNVEFQVWICLTVITIVGSLMLADLTHLRRNLAAANERIDHLQFEVSTLTRTVGELNAEISNQQSSITNGNGGAK